MANENELFNKGALDVSRPDVATSQIRTYLQFFSVRRQRYNQVNRLIAELDPDDALSLNEAYQDFNNRFNEINKTINEAIKANDIDLAVKSLEMFNELFQKMESEYKKYIGQYPPPTQEWLQIYEQIQQEHRQLVNELRLQLENTRSELYGKVQSGIDDLLQIKKEYGFTGAYKDKIVWGIWKARMLSFIYLWAFIISVVLIPVLIAATFMIPDFHELKWYEALIIRASIVATLAWMAAFFHRNYSLKTVLLMKFDHLARLLGGGVATIADLVKSDEAARAKVYSQMPELFLNMDELSEIASKELRSTGRSRKEALELIKEVKAFLREG